MAFFTLPEGEHPSYMQRFAIYNPENYRVTVHDADSPQLTVMLSTFRIWFSDP